MSGYCSLQATSVPSTNFARCTWPRLAAAAAIWPNSEKLAAQPGPSSLCMRRRTNGKPIGGAFACSSASSRAYSSGSASGTVERNCATFIIGPLSPPRIVLMSSAWAERSVFMPRKRAPAMRAAMPPTAPEVCAMRLISPNSVLLSGPGPVMPSPSATRRSSNSSMKPAMMPRPRFQNDGSEASRPNGASRSRCTCVPPARSMALYFAWKSGWPAWNSAYSAFTRQSPNA